MPRYGSMNHAYLGSWLESEQPGGPMWALNLMKYRPVAERVKHLEVWGPLV